MQHAEGIGEAWVGCPVSPGNWFHTGEKEAQSFELSPRGGGLQPDPYSATRPTEQPQVEVWEKQVLFSLN